MLRSALLLILFSYTSVFALDVTNATSSTITQGDVLFIPIKDDCTKVKLTISKLGTYQVMRFENKKLLIVPIDLRKATGTYEVPRCSVYDTASELKTFSIIERYKDTRNFSIPKSEGGNTTKNAHKVKKEIQNDAKIFWNIRSYDMQLWEKPFIYPLPVSTITDTFGYIRDSQGVEVAHKGIDFKASTGEKVHAMNKGIVKYVGTLPSYGKTIVVDHGKGILTVYLHLSKILVSKGSIVRQGQVIGTTGDTGFVTGPHLHVSIHVNGISIDPLSFMKGVGKK